ncbi:MAG: sugar phosphate isomerase/epimerase [Clostridia bacterium]|nr:sugar phosphate isomerase/epimerase [Clostridia bacterium]
MHLDCAEVFLQTISEYELPFAAMVRRNLGDTPCVSMHPAGIQFENQMFGRSARQRADAFDLYRRSLDAGQTLGAQTYVYHGRSTPLLSPLPFQLEANLDVLGLMNEEAKRRGMIVAWENVYWCQLTDCSRIREVKRALPDIRFTLDIKQAMRAGADPIEMAREMGESLVHVHICDWDENRKLCLPGEGQFDFRKLIDTLKDIGYNGPVIMEPYLAMISSDNALEASIAYMQRVLQYNSHNDHKE